MSSWPVSALFQPGLHGSDGELVSIRIAVEPRLLEDLLEALADLPFPVNPELRHGTRSTAVEFPAYGGRLEDVRAVLKAHGFNPGIAQVRNMLEQIRSA